MAGDLFDFTIKLRITAKGASMDYAFGPGTASLLRGVGELKSLNQAAKRMGMAYSKAWKGIRETEKALGFPLIERRGAHGSEVTENGVRLLALYDAMLAGAGKGAEDAYKASDFHVK